MSVFSVIDNMSASFFSSLTALRGKRIFHPRGVVYKGEITWQISSLLPACSLWQGGGTQPVIVRLSWGVGLPEGWPDILGMAVRVVNVYGEGNHQDVLMLSGGNGVIGRHLFWPALDVMNQSYSTVLPYRIFGKLYCFGIMPEEGKTAILSEDVRNLAKQSQLSFNLGLAQLGQAWQKIGVLTLTDELSQVESDALTFNPWNTGKDIHPAGFLNRLRRNTYKASQKARTRSH